MTLVKPNRETFINAYRTITGVELSNTIVDLFFRMVASIRASRLQTYNVIIEWDNDIVRLIPR